MLCTLGTRRMDAALKMLFALSSTCNCILVLMATLSQILSVFFHEVVYAYHNSFLSLMRGILDVRILAMLFSYLSCQAVSTAGNKCKSRPFLSGYMAFLLFNFRILILSHLTLSFLVFLAFLAFFYYILIKSFHKPAPFPHVSPTRYALTCGILPQ